MSLSGNLKDFDISYIVQIIAQEGKTGRLIISTDELEAFVIFKSGRIVSAGSNRKNLQGMIFSYLLSIRNSPRDLITELRAMFHSDLRQFTAELVNRKLITTQEINYIVQTGTEDITCSLFSLKEGLYKFNGLQNADAFEIGGYALQTDMIMMEAARRADENERFGELFSRSTIFIQTEAPDFALPASINPLTQFKEYLYCQIDGATSVDLLCQNMFLSDYQVFQALTELLNDHRITTLPESISNSINAAVKRKLETGTTILIKSGVSSLMTILLVAFFYFLGSSFLPTLLDKQIPALPASQAKEVIFERNTSALLLCRALTGTQPASLADVISQKLLSPIECLFEPQ